MNLNRKEIIKKIQKGKQTEDKKRRKPPFPPGPKGPASHRPCHLAHPAEPARLPLPPPFPVPPTRVGTGVRPRRTLSPATTGDKIASTPPPPRSRLPLAPTLALGPRASPSPLQIHLPLVPHRNRAPPWPRRRRTRGRCDLQAAPMCLLAPPPSTTTPRQDVGRRTPTNAPPASSSSSDPRRVFDERHRLCCY